MTHRAGLGLVVAAVAGWLAVNGTHAVAQQQPPRQRQQPPPPAGEAENPRMARYKDYFANMEEDVSVYDPASPWIYDGRDAWYKRVDQMVNIRQFLDLNQFHRTEVELDDLRIVTVYRELRRVEGSMTSRLHGRITWVYLKKPDGTWSLWHDHTAEIPPDVSYRF